MRAHATLAAVLLALAAIPAAPAVARAPAAQGPAPALAPAPVRAVPSGWVPVFASDFGGPGLPAECTPYDGAHPGPAASYYRPDEVRMSDGMLRLSMRRRDFGGRPYTTGGVGCLRITQRYGRYEFRAKPPAGAGIDAFATLWPETDSEADAALIELLAKPGDEKAVLSNRDGAGQTAKTISGRYSDDFHTFTIEWAPTGFRVEIDGVLKFSDGRVSTARRWLGFAVSSGNAQTGLPDSGTALPAEFLIDYVRVWAYDPSVVVPPAASGSGGGQAAGGSRIEVPGAAGDADWPPLALTVGRLARAHPGLLGMGVFLAVLVGVSMVFLHRRRPRRPPPAHRA